VLYLPCCCTSHGREHERDRGKKRSISLRCFTFPAAPLMVVSARDIEALKKRRWLGGEEKGRRRRCYSRGRKITRAPDGESAQEMRRANHGYQSALSTLGLPK
jgi:hypothetical protein